MAIKIEFKNNFVNSCDLKCVGISNLDNVVIRQPSKGIGKFFLMSQAPIERIGKINIVKKLEKN